LLSSFVGLLYVHRCPANTIPSFKGNDISFIDTHEDDAVCDETKFLLALVIARDDNSNARVVAVVMIIVANDIIVIIQSMKGLIIVMILGGRFKKAILWRYG
jgi:hypothetical protein